MMRQGDVRAPFWLGLALTGQAGILALTDAGKLVHYQHLIPFWQGMTGPQLVIVLGLVAQAALVGVTLAARRHDWLHNTQQVMPARGWVVVLGTAVVLSATLSRELRTYVFEMGAAGFFALTQLATMVLWAWAVPAQTADRWTARWHAWSADRRALFVVAGFAVVAAALVAVLAYERHPHVPDELSYLLGARAFANGSWWLPLMPAPDAFSVDLMTFEDDRWFSPVPPGWPVVLAIGWKLGVPWLVNPVLSGLNVLLAYFVVARLYDRSLGFLVAVLMAASPWHLFMSMNFMTHTLTTTCALGAAAGAVRWAEDKALVWAVVSGAAMGCVGWIRPLEGVIVALTIGLVGIMQTPRIKAFAGVAVMAISSVVVGGTQLLYNRMVTGDPTSFPLMEYTDRIFGPQGHSNALGFGPERGLGWAGLDPLPGHGPLDVLININLNLFQLNTELLGWMGGSLAILAAFFVLRGTGNGADRAMILGVLVVVGLHSFYWFAGGPDFGARYWYLVLIPLLTLAARGVQGLVDRSDRVAGAGRRVGLLTAGLVVSTLLVFVPWRAIDKYHGYRSMRPGVMEVLDERARDGLVFINGYRHPDYHSAVLENSVVPGENGPIFVWVQTLEAAHNALAAFPDREIWIVDGPTITGDRYALRAGPLTPERFRTMGLRLLGFRD